VVLDTAEPGVEFGKLAEQLVFNPAEVGILPVRVGLDQIFEVRKSSVHVAEAGIHVPETGIHVGIVEQDANQHDDDRGHWHDGRRDIELRLVQASTIVPPV
jgi:hypothetical protein